MAIRTGIERVLGERIGLHPGDRVAIVANQATVLPDLTHVVRHLAALSDVRLIRILAPEHGLWGDAQDMIAVGDERDPVTGLEIVSLYGTSEASLRPPPAAFEGVDVVIFDLQDVGARYYTFLATLAYLMEEAGRRGVRVVVADRPNPIGGEHIEGPMIAAGFVSFVGAFGVPVRHGMTAGEVALFLRDHVGLACELTVAKLDGWRRADWYDATGLPWIAPSPNMPTIDTAAVYPGQCLIEGTNLSEGRGTTRPFELSGAAFIDPFALVKTLAAEDLPGTTLRPLYFRPTFHKFGGQRCGGVQIHVTDRATFQPFRTSRALIAASRRLWPERFDWRREPYEFVSDRLAFDLLCGGDRERRALESGAPIADLEAAWRDELAAFREVRERYLIYR
ncbi:MAG: DUF1343 domain-containing protein [Deltaproteobacteria bacterium]|nr:DUF1343 domain-containing protein [Deltaproteobacteria bacterium]